MDNPGQLQVLLEDIRTKVQFIAEGCGVLRADIARLDTRLDAFEHRVDRRFDEFEARVNARFDSTDRRVDQRFASVDRRFAVQAALRLVAHR